MTALFALTAATATVMSDPARLPTTAMSDALKSCSKIAVAATGAAKSRSLLQSGPFSISGAPCFYSFCSSLLFACIL